MRFALNHRGMWGRTISTASHNQLNTLLDKAEHGDTLHKIIEAPESGADLVQLVDGQLAQGEFTTV